MTNERAIELLHRLQDEQFDGIHGDERREALDMAVRALEGDGDTISRKMAIDVLMEIIDRPHHAEFLYTDEICRALNELPSAQPQRKKGKWIKISPANIYECSECGKNVMTDDISAYDFCHGCGADMRGESDD